MLFLHMDSSGQHPLQKSHRPVLDERTKSHSWRWEGTVEIQAVHLFKLQVLFVCLLLQGGLGRH